MSYVLFYAPGTASLAVHWMLIELGVTFEAERLDFEAGEQRSPNYLRLNPAGRVPTLVIDGQPYAESTALLMMLAERHPEAGFAPASGDARREKWLETMIYLANTLLPAMRDWFYADSDGDPAGADAVRKLARHRIEGAWDRLDAMLADGRLHLLGEAITTVDLLATMLMHGRATCPGPRRAGIISAPTSPACEAARPSWRFAAARDSRNGSTPDQRGAGWGVFANASTSLAACVTTPGLLNRPRSFIQSTMRSGQVP